MNSKKTAQLRIKKVRESCVSNDLDNSQEEISIDLDDFQRSLISNEDQSISNSLKPQKTAHMSIIDNFEEIKPISQPPPKTPSPSLPKSIIYLTLTTSLLTISLLYIIKRKSKS